MNEYARKKNVLILAEGFEEKPYIDKMLSFPNIRTDVYRFGPTVNLKGNGNILARYQFEIQRGYYDIVLVFCDADKGSEQFLNIVKEVGRTFFWREQDGMKVFIFANPVTLQIVLSHFGDVSLNKVSKKDNAEAVERLTGIKNYAATKEQIESMIRAIHFNTMDEFKRRLGNISNDFRDMPSTNFLRFLRYFENEDTSWIAEINDLRKRN